MRSDSVFWRRWVRLVLCMMLVAGRSWFAVTALFIAAAPAVWSATSNFVYDEAGRLVEVIAPSGDTARYVYDAAGNIKQIRRSAAAMLSLAEFSPNQGAVGSTVAMYGSGFNPVPANNTVRFGGVTASVSSATPNQLIVAVPAGAVTGPLTVTVGGVTATSAQPYTVLPAAAGLPSIAGVAPTNGGAGTAVTLTGSGFDADRSKLLVTLNGRPVAVTASTATSIDLIVGPEATTGRFEVITPMGRATSAADFFVPPAGDSNDSVAQRTRIVVDGPSLAISTLVHNKVALVAFDGTAGQRMAIGAHNFSSSPAGGSAAVSVTAPNGKVLFSCAEVWTSGRQCVLPELPTTGTYLIRTKATASGGSVSLTLTASSDLVMAVPVDGGAPSVFTVTRPGQRARAVFAAEAGRRYTVAATEQTVPGPAQFEARAADGRLLGSMAVSPAPAALQGLDISAGPIAGPVQVTIDPSIGGTGRIGWIVQSDVAGTLSTGGSPVSLSLTSGRNARLTFAGSAGQTLSLGYTNLVVVPPGGGATVVLKVNDPTGALVHACNVYSSSVSESCALPMLRADGEHSVTVETQGTVSASLMLTLSSDVSGTLVVDAPSATTFAATRAGQNGRYQFAGVAGQRIAVLASGVTVAGGAMLKALDPAGNTLGSTTVTPASLPSLDVGPLSTAGTYTVVVDPYQAQTGQVGLRVVSDVALTSLAVDGASKTVALSSGQNAHMTFSGTAGQRIGIGLASLATDPPGGSVKVSVLKPDGSALHQCKFGGGYTAPDNCALPPLLTTGVHTLVIDPQLSHGASLTVWASTPVSGAISVDAASPKVFATTRPGQNAQFTFAGLAGTRYSVMASNSTIAGASTVTVTSPSGASVASTSVTGGGAPTVLDLPALVEGGAYGVTVNTAGANTGQMDLRVVSEPTPTLAVDGAALPMTLLPGQNGRAGFTGTAGQRLGLGLTGMSTVPAGGAITVRVVGPTGLDWYTCSTYATSNPAGSCNLPALPASGTYQVVVDPLGGNSAQATLTLSSDIQSALVVNPAAPTTFTTSRFGQNGRYTFEAAAGGNYTVSFSGITIPGTSTAFTLLKPDGVQLAATFGGAGSAPPPIVASNVPATGTYTVLVDPVAGAVGGASLRVDQTGTTPPAAQTPQGSIALDGAATALSVPAGQTYRYTFSGTQGHYISLGFTSAATSPAGASPTMWVTRPDNTNTLVNCPFAAGSFACDLPALPSTGTYTLRVQTTGSASMSGNVIASTAAAGVLAIDAVSPTAVATLRAGQQARYTFAGSAGDRLNMAITAGTYPAGTNYQLSVLRPDGGTHAGMLFSPGATTNVLDLPELTATGNYTVLGDPSGASTGQVSLQLRRVVTGALTVDGAAASINLAQGNDGRYTFSATNGQALSLGFPTLAIAPATGSVIVRVLGPDGGLHTNCYGGNGPFTCALAPVVRTGSYVVVLEAPTGGVVTGALNVSDAAAGTLTADGATQLFVSGKPGQLGRYTFAGTAGQHLSLLVTGNTLATSSEVRFIRPDGASLWTGYLASSSTTLDVPDLPMSGTYTLVVVPNKAALGQASLALKSGVLATLSTDGTPLSMTLVSGANGYAAFSGVAGQSLGLGLTGISVAPAGSHIAIQLRKSDGTHIASCLTTSAPGSCNLGPLPMTGSYTVFVDAVGTAAATFTLTLTADQTLPLTVDAPALVAFNSTAAGRNARYTFDAMAGEAYNVAWSALAFGGGSVAFTVTSPSGKVIGTASSTLSGGVVDLGRLAEDGTYGITVDPAGAATGSLSIGVRRTGDVALAVDAPPTTGQALLLGQARRYGFDGVAGANLGVELSGVVTSPASAETNPLKVELVDYVGTVLKSCTAGAANNLSCRFAPLPATGRYTVKVSPGPNSAAYAIRLRSTL